MSTGLSQIKPVQTFTLEEIVGMCTLTENEMQAAFVRNGYGEPMNFLKLKFVGCYASIFEQLVAHYFAEIAGEDGEILPAHLYVKKGPEGWLGDF